MTEDHPDRIDAVVADTSDYHDIAMLLRDAADDDRLMLLLADVMQMMFAAGGDGERFIPFATFTDGSATLSPSRITEDDIAVLRTVRSANAAVEARVADVLWERVRGAERVAQAHRAVDAYIRLAETTEWHDAATYLRRAQELASRFRGTDDGAREDRLRTVLRTALNEADTVRQLIGASSLLRTGTVDEQLRTEAIEALTAASASAEHEENFPLARDVSSELRAWLPSEDPARHDITSRIADLWALEADSRFDGITGSALVAMSFVENAIQTLRSIPRRHRRRVNAENRIVDLRRKMADLNEAAMDEMTAVESDPVDLSEAAAEAKSRVSGLEALEALAQFGYLFPLADKATDRAQAERLVAGSFASLLSTTTFTRDGRVADKSSTEDAVDRQMGQDGQLRRHLYTVGMILPALHQLRQEHSLSLPDFHRIALASAVVPPGQEQLVAAGLHAGWNLDMGVAVHLLVPRLEAIVRHHLKSADVSTTELKPDGREQELSLPPLLTKAETAEVFGDRAVYELEGLFAGRFGANLRHDVAHGLVDDATAGTVLSVYAWWLVLRLVLTPFFNQLVAAPPPESAT